MSNSRASPSAGARSRLWATGLVGLTFSRYPKKARDRADKNHQSYKYRNVLRLRDHGRTPSLTRTNANANRSCWFPGAIRFPTTVVEA
jgi:hypothetical protein